MKIRKLWLSVSVVMMFFLQGCLSTRSFVSTASKDHWKLAGKIAIIYPNNRCKRDHCPPRSDQGSLEWEQDKNDYSVSVFDPFARMVIEIRGNNEQLQAKVRGREPIVASPSEFLALIVGQSKDKKILTNLSPNDLRYWLTGRPVPDIGQVNRGDKGFEQKGFIIGGEQWRETSMGKMPSLIVIEKEGFKLRVVVNKWDDEFK